MSKITLICSALIIILCASCAINRALEPEWVGRWDLNDGGFITITKGSRFKFVATEEGKPITVASGIIENVGNGARLTATKTSIDKIQEDSPMLELKLIDKNKMEATDLQWGGDTILLRRRD